jgi:hypothetical protein
MEITKIFRLVFSFRSRQAKLQALRFYKEFMERSEKLFKFHFFWVISGNGEPDAAPNLFLARGIVISHAPTPATL